VLAGVVGAVVAAAAAGGDIDAETLGPLAASAAWIHGRAAYRAAMQRGPRGGPITALDVAESVPYVVGSLIGQDEDGDPTGR
jgi:NAD(P)H-hydrate repair Nnr-like enzyme with NAD(P)H-hydrate dehydratase domain